MEKFLLSARTVDLRKRRDTDEDRLASPGQSGLYGVLRSVLQSLTLRARRWTQEQQGPDWAGPAWMCHTSPLAGRAETSPAWRRRRPRCTASDWTTTFHACRQAPGRAREHPCPRAASQRGRTRLTHNPKLGPSHDFTCCNQQRNIASLSPVGRDAVSQEKCDH